MYFKIIYQYIKKFNKWKKFEKGYKSNLLLELIFLFSFILLFLLIFFLSKFPSNFSRVQRTLNVFQN